VNERSALSRVERVVVKIGSRLLRDDLNGRVAMLAEQIHTLRAGGIDVVLVSSGAIALGVSALNLPSRPTELAGLQAAAAVGQGRLIQIYQQVFAERDMAIGQVLLTHDDVRNRHRYLNARLTFGELLRYRAVPIVNENDTVSVDEIKFGDNDKLAALVTSLVSADLLVILTDVEGLYDRDPAQGGTFVSEVRDIEAVRAGAGGSSSGVGTGGMSSKVEAAAIAGRFGVPTVIASGRAERPLRRILDGEAVGTVFWPQVERLAARKHWIAYALRPRGKLTVDDGARAALVQKNKSLLASGVRKVEGNFDMGDPVELLDERGRAFARGLCALESDELMKVAGRRGAELPKILGYPAPGVIVHRDDLVIL
jgi:glutamate 5-kinase